VAFPTNIAETDTDGAAGHFKKPNLQPCHTAKHCRRHPSREKKNKGGGKNIDWQAADLGRTWHDPAGLAQ